MGKKSRKKKAERASPPVAPSKPPTMAVSLPNDSATVVKPTDPKPGEQNSRRIAEAVSLILAVIGGAGLVFLNFWLGVVVMNIGGFILLIVLFWEKGLIRATSLFALVLALGYVNWQFFQPAPLEVVINRLANGEYGPGNTPAGVPWEPNFTYSTVAIVNQSDSDIADVDLTLDFTDSPITAIAPLSDFSAVELHGDITKEVEVIEGVEAFQPSVRDNGKNADIPLRQLATPLYRVRCPKIAKRGSVNLIVATAKPNGVKSVPLIFTLDFQNTNDPGVKRRLWFGPRDDPGAKVVYDKVAPTKIVIRGSYVANFRTISATSVKPVMLQQPAAVK